MPLAPNGGGIKWFYFNTVVSTLPADGLPPLGLWKSTSFGLWQKLMWRWHTLWESRNAMCPHYSDIRWELLHLQPLATWLLAQQLVQANNKEVMLAPHYWPFVRGIHWWPVDSPHKGPVMWKALPCHDVFMSDHHSNLSFFYWIMIICQIVNHWNANVPGRQRPFLIKDNTILITF